MLLVDWKNSDTSIPPHALTYPCSPSVLVTCFALLWLYFELLPPNCRVCPCPAGIIRWNWRNNIWPQRIWKKSTSIKSQQYIETWTLCILLQRHCKMVNSDTSLVLSFMELVPVYQTKKRLPVARLGIDIFILLLNLRYNTSNNPPVTCQWVLNLQLPAMV